jgi:hypothetical protein
VVKKDKVEATRIPKSKADLKQELRDQLQLLRLSCESFDKGVEAAGKHISLSLRVLLHYQGRSNALLQQLGYRSGKYLSSGVPISPGNLLTEASLLAMTMSPAGMKWIPLIAVGNDMNPPRYLPFSDWWLEPVLKDNKGRKFSRLDLVKHVADTDGGAHVDPGLDEAYMDLSRNNSLGWVISSTQLPLENRVELA